MFKLNSSGLVSHARSQLPEVTQADEAVYIRVTSDPDNAKGTEISLLHSDLEFKQQGFRFQLAVTSIA